MAQSEFDRAVQDACESALVAVGFKRLRRSTIIWEISEKFWGWVGLNRGNHGDMVRVNPFIGIHAVDLMKLCDQLDESKYSKGAYATYAIHLGEILPDELVFEFHKGRDLSHDAERLAKCVADADVHAVHSRLRCANPLIQRIYPDARRLSREICGCFAVEWQTR